VGYFAGDGCSIGRRDHQEKVVCVHDVGVTGGERVKIRGVHYEGYWA